MAREQEEIGPRKEYNPQKPDSQRVEEEAIRDNLIESGVPKEIAEAVVGYRPDDIPYIFRAEPHEVIDGSGGGMMQPEIWIGTTADIPEIIDADWRDQIPEVIAQWRGHIKKDTQQIVSREEVHQIGDGSFIRLEYEGVGGMGQFDGKLRRISLYVPNNTFNPYGGPDRMSYTIHYFKNQAAEGESSPRWMLDMDRVRSGSNMGGTTILNGLQEMINFHMGGIHQVKGEAEKAFRFTELTSLRDRKKTLTAEVKPQDYIEDKKLELIESLRDRAHTLMQELAPKVREKLLKAKNYNGVIQMAIDGILNHPEKIKILDRTLADASAELRWNFCQAIAKEIKSRRFQEWLQTLDEPAKKGLEQDVARTNAEHLLDWFRRTAPPTADLSGWLSKAESQNQSMAFMRVLDGMEVSFVERYIEYQAQLYLGRTL